MNIRTRLYVNACLSVATAVVVGVTLLSSYVHVKRALSQGRAVSEIAKGVFELSILTNDYLLHRERRAEEQWRTRHSSLREELSAIALEKPDEQSVLRRMRLAHSDMKPLFSELAATGPSGTKTHQSPEGSFPGSTDLETRMAAQLLVKAQAMVEDASWLAEMAARRAAQAQRQASVAVAMVVFVTAGIVGLTSFLVSRSVVRPVARLHEGTEIIGAGNLDHKVGTAVKDEIGQLSRAFDRMTEKLKSTTTSRDRLAEEVKRREEVEKQLRETMTELERSNRDLEQFAYVASHDLQQPLRLVTSYVELLARRYKGKLDTDADEFISFALDSANRMQRLIRDLLAYARVEMVGKPLVETSCNEALNTALMNLRPLVEETSAEVTHDPLPTVTGDELQLVQLFQNLVGNAVKFHGPLPPKVHVSAERRNGEWLLSVRDNGIGMDPKHAERIFLVFQRLHTPGEYQGTGIGLAICKKIVEHHGGSIWVESELGEGSTFYFTIPTKGGPQH